MSEPSAEHFDFVVIFNLDKNSASFWEYMQCNDLIVKQKKRGSEIKQLCVKWATKPLWQKM